MKKILILNTGGTFNKIYDEITGELIVPRHNNSLKKIIVKSKLSNIAIDGLIYKDSLNITKRDRQILLEYINKSKIDNIIIVHGTDTMDKTAQYLSGSIINKQIILTGAMKPYSIEKTEAVSNLMAAYGYIQSNKKNGVYISMHGLIKKHNKIKKNKTLGVFECL
ncbi:MAG: asparaginase domain-containing protein [Campylobacterota bacterium]|nr:asparaginase domain-containing protein [Campylobacterota bacterium]